MVIAKALLMRSIICFDINTDDTTNFARTVTTKINNMRDHIYRNKRSDDDLLTSEIIRGAIPAATVKLQFEMATTNIKDTLCRCCLRQL